jgi:hypothetical protein
VVYARVGVLLARVREPNRRGGRPETF